MRATVFAYTRVEPVPGQPNAHTCTYSGEYIYGTKQLPMFCGGMCDTYVPRAGTMLTYSDLKGGLQQKMSGQMEKAMISRESYASNHSWINQAPECLGCILRYCGVIAGG